MNGMVDLMLLHMVKINETYMLVHAVRTVHVHDDTSTVQCRLDLVDSSGY